MKATTHSSNYTMAKLLLLLVMCLNHPALMASSSWMMVFQNSQGETQEIAMSDVGSLVAVDDAYDFTILSTTGGVLAEGVLKVSFSQNADEAIRPVASLGNMLARAATDKLTLFGVSGEVLLYDAVGVLQKRVTAVGGETVVSLANLPTGAYVVKVGKQTFKFMKK